MLLLVHKASEEWEAGDEVIIKISLIHLVVCFSMPNKTLSDLHQINKLI